MDLSFLKNSRSFNVDDGINLLKSGGFITMSWGVEKLEEVMTADGVTRGLKFSVNGYKFQGEVVLSVNFMDYYEARFFQDGELVHTIEDIFVGDAIMQIDEYVEKQPEYKY